MRDRAVSRCLLLTFILLDVGSAVAQPLGDDPRASDAEVFARVFQRARAHVRAPTVLVIEGENRVPIVVDLRPGTSPRAPSAPLLAALGPKLCASARTALIAAVRDQQLSIDSLRALGLDATYDSRRLELRIAIPPRLMESRSHLVHGAGAPPETIGALRPSDLSGYLNVRAGGGRSVSDGAQPNGGEPFHAAFDGAIAVRGWVVEGRFDVGEEPIGVHRGDVLVSHDDTTRALRWLGGDFAVPTAGLQPGYAVMGVGVARNFSLQPHRTVQPVGKFDFILDRPSRVTVLVNHAPVHTLWLASGRHDVRDLPLGAGTNDIDLVIRDDQGVERRLSFSATDPGELLAPGIAQFTLNAGFPLIGGAGLRSYDFARPIVSARRRWGMTPRSTVGGSLDAQLDRQLAGGSLLHVTSLGSIAIELAASRDAVIGAGHAEGLRYDFARSGGGSAITTLAVVAHRYSPGFRWLAVDAAAGRYRGDVAVSANRGLSGLLLGRLAARYQLGRDRSDSIDASVGLSRAFGGVDVDASIGFHGNSVTASGARLFVSARWSLSRRGGSLRARSQISTTGETTSEVGYTGRAGLPPGGLAASLSVRESPGALSAHGDAQYIGYRFISRLSTTSTLDHGQLTQASSIEVATALAFAGGRVAWSRPITGSFAIVAASEAVTGFPIGVNPARGGYGARTDASGLAVIPNLEAYRVGVIRLEAPTLPVGYSLGPSSYKVLPAYRSGTLILVGERGTIFARGTLRARGIPIAFGVGELTSLDDKTLPALVVMSNRAGRFAVTGLVPGSYELRINGHTARLTIPRNAAGIVSADIDVDSP